jgi:hypothetical protein
VTRLAASASVCTMCNMLGSGEHLDDELVRRAGALARRARRDPLVDELLRAEGAHCEPKTIAVVRDLDEWTVSLLGLVLADEFRREAPRVGELVAVRYDGRAWPQTVGTPYAKYRLLVDRGAGDNVDEALL